MITLDEIWNIEKQIIRLLHKIQEQQFLKEGQRKVIENIFEKDQSINKRPSQFNPESILKPSSNILLPETETFNIAPTASQQTTNDFMANILMMEEKISQNDLTFIKKSIKLNKEKSDDNAPQFSNKRLKNPIEELDKLVAEASNLSIKLLTMEADSEIDYYLCDTITSKDVNILTGGDGFIEKDGKKQELPNDFIAKTCPKRKGNIHLKKWIFECVLCPVNYLQNRERFKQWQNFIKEIQNEQKNNQGEFNV